MQHSRKGCLPDLHDLYDRRHSRPKRQLRVSLRGLFGGPALGACPAGDLQPGITMDGRCRYVGNRNQSSEELCRFGYGLLSCSNYSRSRQCWNEVHDAQSGIAVFERYIPRPYPCLTGMTPEMLYDSVTGQSVQPKSMRTIGAQKLGRRESQFVEPRAVTSFGITSHCRRICLTSCSRSRCAVALSHVLYYREHQSEKLW